jgi:uncharacterized repeat protein (TIGR03803 family)
MACQWNAASVFSICLRTKPAAFVPLIILQAVLGISLAAQAQTLSVLHNFTGQGDGDGPFAGVTLDQQGRVYGTALLGGSHGQGLVYRLVHEGEGWVFSPLYSFGSQQHDGNQPYARVVFGPNGVLYGTTYEGGVQDRGTVFSLQPPASACKSFVCPWIETVLYNFTGGSDGGYPFLGDLTFDQAGNIYGTTAAGGGSGYGVVFKLTRSGSHWTESVLWDFTCGDDGCDPYAGLLIDGAGNLYGTTQVGGAGGIGTVYELSPTQSGWSETTLSSLPGVSGTNSGGLALDAHGNLFGLTGDINPGSVYELMPQSGGWSFAILKTFTVYDFIGPLAAPTVDAGGDVYGPLPNGGDDEAGEIFKMTRAGGQWIYSSFYQFTNGDGGVDPIGAVTFDPAGNMYGTSNAGGPYGYGVVWEITP